MHETKTVQDKGGGKKLYQMFVNNMFKLVFSSWPTGTMANNTSNETYVVIVATYFVDNEDNILVHIKKRLQLNIYYAFIILCL